MVCKRHEGSAAVAGSSAGTAMPVVLWGTTGANAAGGQ